MDFIPHRVMSQATQVAKKLTSTLLKTEWLLVLLAMLWGLGLRAYRPDHTPFAFDQVQILENATAIAQGDLRLIGPRTGPAAMFTGPLIYYLTAGWTLVWNSPYTLVLTSLTISAITGLTLWALTRLYWSRKLSFIMLALWAFSPFLVLLDRTPWNPNLMVLASALVLFPMLHLAQSDTPHQTLNLLHWRQYPYWRELILIGLGSAFGYQAHFTGLLLPAMLLLPLLVQPKRWWPAFLASGSGLALSLLPTFLFDLRHNWLNLRGLFDLVWGQQTAVSPKLHEELGRTGLIMVETLGKLLGQYNHPLLLWALGFSLLGLIWLNHRPMANRPTWLVILSWLLVTLVTFSFYHGAKPEYYFLLIVPVWLWLLTSLATKLGRPHQINQAWLGAVVVFGLYSSALTWWHWHSGSALMIGNQLAARDFILEQAEKQPLGPLAYDLQPVESIGLQYLLQNYQPHPQAPLVHLMYPTTSQDMAHFYREGLSVWIDSRQPEEFGSLLTGQYLLKYPREAQLYQQFEPPLDMGNTNYVLMANGQPLGTTSILRIEDNKDFYEQTVVTLTKAHKENPYQRWVQIRQTPLQFAMNRGPLLLIWTPAATAKPLTTDEILTWLEQLDLQVDHPVAQQN